MKKTIFALLMALLLTVPVFGTETEVIDETRIPIEDTMFDSMGWLSIRANTPERFEGTLYIELINDATGECFTDTLTSSEWYIGGKWLDVGKYTVKEVYAFNRDYYTVESSVSTVEITSEADAEMILTVTEDPSVGDAWTAAMATHPTREPEPEETASPTATASPSESIPATEPSETEPAASETAPTTEPGETSAQSGHSWLKKAVLSIASSVLFAVVAIWVAYRIRKKHYETDF